LIDLLFHILVLKAVKILASCFSDPSKSKEAAHQQLWELSKGATPKVYTSIQTITAMLYMWENNNKDAIRAVGGGGSMEQCVYYFSFVIKSKVLNCFLTRRAILIQLYLRMDRVDVAQKELKMMKICDEESCLTMICTAWINLALVFYDMILLFVDEEDTLMQLLTGWCKNSRSFIYF
jgi:hypothetical protein